MKRATSGLLKGLNPTVSIISKVVVIVFVLFGALMTEQASAIFGVLKNYIILGLNWYYIGVVAFFLFFVIWLLFGHYGDIRLGDDDERPEFSYFAWFAMLFSAGMGIGLVFWSIAEPITHFQNNPFTEGMTPEAAQTAMRLTFLHWGLHPWAIYVIVGLSLSYFAYRKKLPLTIRSSLYPVIGERIYGPIGHTADVLAVFGTVFGLATSLGLGAQQMNTGLNLMFGISVSESNQLLLIAIVTLIATISVASGVGRGIRIISELNLWLSIILLVFFLVFGPTRYLLLSLLQNIGDYMAAVIPLSLWTDANKDTGWQDNWTTFYWGWWIAWSPFVGIFIARISKGRTIREFVLGVLLVPTLLAFVWLTLLGGTAIHMELFHTVTNEAGEVIAAIGQAGIAEAVKQDLTVALYTTFEKMDVGVIGTLASGAATLLVATYFITSSDSATLVVNTILSIGDEEPPLIPRIFWGIGEGFVAAVLLIAGGLPALQTASITAALPFSIIILIMIYGLVKALGEEKATVKPS